jgi:hypothetical protein
MRVIRIMALLSIALCISPAVIMASPEKGPSSGAVNVAGVVMEKTVDLEGYPADLVGAGLLRYRVIFKGYVAGLYLSRGRGAEDVFKDIPKRLEIEYFHAIPAQGFIDATQVGLANNLSREQLASIQNRANTLYALYRDVKPGDRYAVTYIPGVGSRVALNNKVLGTIGGLDFANAFFSIWLGRNPLDQELKRALLGR